MRGKVKHQNKEQGEDTKIQVVGEKKEEPKESNERIRDTQRRPASKDLAQDPRDVIVCPHHPSKRNALLRRWRLKVCCKCAHHPRHRRRRGQRRVVGSLIHSRDAGRHRRRKQHRPHRCTSSTGGLCVCGQSYMPLSQPPSKQREHRESGTNAATADRRTKQISVQQGARRNALPKANEKPART